MTRMVDLGRFWVDLGRLTRTATGRSLISSRCGDPSPLPTTASGPRGPCFELVALRATARSALTGTVGQGRSRFENSPRRLEATRDNGTQRDSRSTAVRPHSQPHPKRTTEGPGNQHRRPYARFPRHERSQPGHRPSTRSGPSPARSWPMSRTSRTRSASAERAQTSSASSRSTPERQARLSAPLDRRSSEPAAGA